MTYFLKGDTLSNMESDLLNTLVQNYGIVSQLSLRTLKSASQFRAKLKVYFPSQYDKLDD